MSDSSGEEYQDMDIGEEFAGRGIESSDDEEGYEDYEDQQDAEGSEDNEGIEEEEELDEDQVQRLAAEEKQIKELLKHTSYETLLKLKKEDSGLSSFSKKIKKERITTRPGAGKVGDKKEAKSKSKTMPKERNAKIPVSRYQTIVKSSKPKVRDPRFDGLSGTLNQELFQKSYGFLIDQKQNEIKTLQKTISDSKHGGKKKRLSEDELRKLKAALGKNKEEMNRFKKNDEFAQTKRESKKAVEHKAGKASKPFFVKQSEIKKKVLEKKFNELDRTKKLQKVMDAKKKRQSNRILGEFRKVQKATKLRNERNKKKAAARMK